MRTKSLQAPTPAHPGDEWLSPEGHSTSWHRIFDGFAWKNAEVEEDTEETEDTEEETQSTEETTGERRNETAVSDRDGKQEPDAGSKQPAHGKQGKGRQGKRGK